jgi:hypothetical protein
VGMAYASFPVFKATWGNTKKAEQPSPAFFPQ